MDTSRLIHIGAEAILLLLVAYRSNSQINELRQEIQMLRQYIAEKDTIFNQRFAAIYAELGLIPQAGSVKPRPKPTKQPAKPVKPLKPAKPKPESDDEEENQNQSQNHQASPPPREDIEQCITDEELQKQIDNSILKSQEEKYHSDNPPSETVSQPTELPSALPANTDKTSTTVLDKPIGSKTKKKKAKIEEMD
jgi:hypothetical protein